MKPLCVITGILILSFIGCIKDGSNQQNLSIPNGDFELWDNMPILLNWQTNSCPSCDPPFNTYIVQKVTDAFSGKFAAKFICNSVYRSFAFNKFSISLHPTHLTGYIKSTIESGDTVFIHIDLFSGNSIIDNGNWYETITTPDYKKIEIPISQNTSSADSALIRITGGKKPNTELYADDFVLVRINKY